MVFEILLIVSVIKFKYYLIFLTPVAALLAGKPLWLATKKHKLGILLAAVFIGYLFYTGTEITKPYYEEIPSITEFAEFIDQHTQEDDLVVIPFLDPARLDLSSRRGWRANIDLYDHIPRDIEGELKFFEESGAKYFIVKDGYIYNDFDGSYLGYLEQNYQKLLFDDGYVMYVLDGTAKAGAQ